MLRDDVTINDYVKSDGCTVHMMLRAENTTSDEQLRAEAHSHILPHPDPNQNQRIRSREIFQPVFHLPIDDNSEILVNYLFNSVIGRVIEQEGTQVMNLVPNFRLNTGQRVNERLNMDINSEN